MDGPGVYKVAFPPPLPLHLPSSPPYFLPQQLDSIPPRGWGKATLYTPGPSICPYAIKVSSLVHIPVAGFYYL